MKYNISKSRYCSAVQCPKILWLKKNNPDAFDSSVMNQSVLDTGSAVGDLAMSLFGDYVEVPFGDLGDMVFHRLDRISNISFYDKPIMPLRDVPGY